MGLDSGLHSGNLYTSFTYTRLLNEDRTTGEIDIMEQIRNRPDVEYTTFHCNYTGGSIGKQTTNTSYINGYHTYGVQWIPNALYWFHSLFISYIPGT